jgi:hypothetical protein
MIGRIIKFFQDVNNDCKKQKQLEVIYHHKRMQRKLMRNCTAEQKPAKFRKLQQSLCKSLIHLDQQNNPKQDEE